MANYKLIECIFMKPTRFGRTISGETINKVLPRFEYLNLDSTIMDIKKFFFEKIKYAYKKRE